MNTTKLSTLCDKLLETGWLLAAIITPLFFNVYSSNVFERDKWTTLRSIAVVMAAIWLARWIEERTHGNKGLQITWRTPLVLPTLATILVYLVSTLFSLTPYVSFFGGYQRMRGVYSNLACITVFLIALDRMRTRAQVDRFVTVVILNSLPIALYGFLQHNELDPLPWGGDVTQRIASNMGNPIFVAAYMIMAALPTLSRIVDAFRSILTEEDTGMADVLRAAAYIFMFLVQIISIWYSQSRGPLMGLVAGLGVWAFLGLLALQQAARQRQRFQPGDLWKDLGLGAAFGLASALAAAGLAVGVFYASRAIFAAAGDTLQWVALAVGMVAFLGAWMALMITRRGWRWLWASAFSLALLFAAGFLVVNLVEPVRAWSNTQPWLGRLDDVLQAEGGTGKVRNLIWQGAFEMVQPHAPLEYPPTETSPEWKPDALASLPVVGPYLRALVGHGPESMYVAYNRFYPPELGHYERRTATPDRSHNETMDALVTSGILGLAAYLWLFGAIFYFGLRWLGFLPGDWRRTLFLALLVGGAVAVTAAVIPTLGIHFFCLAIPVGMVGGMFLYLVVYAFSTYWGAGGGVETHPRFILMAGLLSAMVAHLIEINFGIAIASTLTTFWAYAALLVLIGTGLIGEREAASEPTRGERGEERQKGRRRRRQRQAASSSSLPAWLGPTLTLAIVGGFILGTLAFDFVTAPNKQEPDNPVVTVWYALTVMGNKNQQTCNATWDAGRGLCVFPGVLMVVGFTWAMSAVVFIAQMAKEGAFHERQGDWGLATALYLLIALAVGAALALAQAGRLHTRISIAQLADHIAGHITTYYGFIAVALAAGGLALFFGERQQPRKIAGGSGTIALVGLVGLAVFTSARTNLLPIQADMVYKQATAFEAAEGAEFNAAINLYERTIQMAPNEDFYRFEQGRVYLMSLSKLGLSALPAAAEQFAKARQIAPLNTDHSRGMAKVYQVWADVGEAELRADRLRIASANYEIATSLSPQNLLLWNEWAEMRYFSMGDEAGYNRTIQHSLEVDPAFDETWLIQANVHIARGEWEAAASDLARALELNPQARPEAGRTPWRWLSYPNSTYTTTPQINYPTASAWYPYGMALAALGRDQEAIQAFLKATEFHPGADYAWDCYLRIAQLYHRSGEIEDASYYIQLAWQLAPENGRFVIQLAMAQMQAPPVETEP